MVCGGRPINKLVSLTAWGWLCFNQLTAHKWAFTFLFDSTVHHYWFSCAKPNWGVEVVLGQLWIAGPRWVLRTLEWGLRVTGRPWDHIWMSLWDWGSSCYPVCLVFSKQALTITERCWGDSPLCAHSCFPEYIGMRYGEVCKICLSSQFSEGTFQFVEPGARSRAGWAVLAPMDHLTRKTGLECVCCLLRERWPTLRLFPTALSGVLHRAALTDLVSILHHCCVLFIVVLTSL